MRHAVPVNERGRTTDIDSVDRVAGLVQVDGIEVGLVIVERAHDPVLRAADAGGDLLAAAPDPDQATTPSLMA